MSATSGLGAARWSAQPAAFTGARQGGVSVARALGSSTRAGIYEHLREAGTALTVRDVAGAFDLHPNVARTHLETLADANLVAVGRRKHPGGGRPAKVYLARPDGEGPSEQPGQDGPRTGTPPDNRLLVRLLVTLLEQPAALVGAGERAAGSLPCRAHEVAAAEGRRLVSALPRGADGPGLEAAAQLAVRALRVCAPEARVLRAGQDWVDIAGVRGIFRGVGELSEELADGLERGLLSGALAAAGRPATLTDAGTVPRGGHAWRARAAAPAASARAAIAPAATVDARGLQREAGVVRAMRTVTGLRATEVLEVLAEGPGAPAAFARWADRAGHELLGVERATDAAGRPAIRLLIRKGG